MSDTQSKLAIESELRIVAIGASAGGLDACTKLIDSLPATPAMAFVLVQHLDPHHESMMAELLASHTAMTVLQASDGITIAVNHLYIIPPGRYLSVSDSKLHLSAPEARHGARMPFDHLLNSLAEENAALTTGIILSGTGADGALGLKALRSAGGFTIAQDPTEAEYGGMPSAAIAADAIDLILPVRDIAAALSDPERRRKVAESNAGTDPNCLVDIIALIRASTNHDFAPYKSGTLERRIERRMNLIACNTMQSYLDRLKNDPAELDLLANDLLINVTSFFRDPAVFEMLAAKIVPDMVRDHPTDRPLRLWVCACSTGEEAYSLAMLFREAIIAAKRDIKLQVFASDVDVDAIASARDGSYPLTIASHISPERIARFFIKEDHGYRVSPELRAAVVFTVQDVLADPPFSRLDMISCRNMLIYFGPEAQAKVIALFHFALREGGTLLLGNAETVGSNDGRFKVISKAERLFRQVGHKRPADFAFQAGQGELARGAAPPGQSPIAHQNRLAAFVQKLVIETHCPAAVLINQKQELLYSLGPTERYLRVASGHPSHEILAMAPRGLRTKLRSAIQQATDANAPIIVTGGRGEQGGQKIAFDLHVRPVENNGEALLLLCFVDVPLKQAKTERAVTPSNAKRVAELEHELEVLRTELQGAIHNLETSSEEQRAVNEEALSVNEEFQSTNEELLTSKEELQSMNEELTALNSQLQETLDRQRVTSNDLQNVLYSTDVATLFLDPALNIRFYTPATTSLFNLIPSDIGRPLTDLKSLSSDDLLTDDARKVLANREPIEREIATEAGMFYSRRILPYLTDDEAIEGVVITFTNITERKEIGDALEEAGLEADRANMAKSRFLAAASHDLRQPLQTLALLQGLLAKTVEGEKAQTLVTCIDEALCAMTGMLNILLDINQIDAGIVQATIVPFAVNDILERLRHEFSYHAEAKRLSLRVVPCSLWVNSDTHLLEQMLRNLIANAIKYTTNGKILIGCRRHGGQISIQIWDSGVGIDADQLSAIFDEYHQVDNPARERSQGLGLGLSIVKRLSDILRHAVHVQSVPEHGSMFSIDVLVADGQLGVPQTDIAAQKDVVSRRGSTILLIEDDPEVSELLAILLTDEGHRVEIARDGAQALERVKTAKIKPALIVSDYNLPRHMNGVEATTQLRSLVGSHVPVIILTGDISTNALRDIADHECVQLNKPVKPKMLAQTVDRLLAGALSSNDATTV